MRSIPAVAALLVILLALVGLEPARATRPASVTVPILMYHAAGAHRRVPAAA